MFVSDRIVFVELQKTGCTHIRKLLKEIVGGELIDKHNQAGSHLFTGDRFFLGSIRNPWEWYVSHWAYGCDGKGTVYYNVTTEGWRGRGRGWKKHPVQTLADLLQSRPNRHAQAWRRTYRDANDPGAFREWLHMLHDPAYRSDIGEGYWKWPASRFAGLLTWRYMKLFTCREGGLGTLKSIATPEQLAGHESGECFIDCFVRNERLESDLLDALARADIVVPPATVEAIRLRPKTNASSKKHAAQYYYDAATEKLVGDREKLIVEKFGYLAPGAGACGRRVTAPV